MPRPNLRELSKGNLTAFGTLTKKTLKVQSVSIGTPSQPFGEQFIFAVKLNNGSVVESKAFNRAQLSSVADRTFTPNKKDGWTKEASGFAIEGYSFVFIGEKVIQFKASVISLPGKTFSPTLGKADGSKWYPFPLTEPEFIELFGDPEETTDKVIN